MDRISKEKWLRIGKDAGWVDSRGMVVAEAKHRPPKAWFDKKMKEIKEGSDYDDDTARKVVGDIWYNELSDSKREEIYKRHGEGKSPNK